MVKYIKVNRLTYITYKAELKTHKYASRHLLFLSNAACLNLRADISSPSSPATEPFLKNEKST